MSNRTLVVEVCHASNLSPKDGEGSASPYVEVDFDSQRQRTKTKIKDLNPVWNEKLVFAVSDPELIEEECIEAHVYTQKRNGQRHSMGKAKVHGYHIRKKGSDGWDKPMPFPLERKWLFSMVKGELFLKVYYYDEAREALAKQEKAKEAKKEAAHGGGGHGGGGGGGGGGGMQVHHEKKNGGGGADVKKTELNPAVHEMRYDSPSTEASSFDVRSTHPNLNWEKVSHDLVAPMEHLFVRVVKARNLAAKDVTGSSDPFVEVKVGTLKPKTRTIPQSLNPEWNQVFAFGQDKYQAQFVEITVWDEDTVKNDFLGYVSFEIAEIPERRPPDSPLAPQWYKLEPKKDEKRVKGEIMLSVWIGTQADEAFPESWQSDTGGHSHNRSKVYLSPRLWYLRVHVKEAQDLVLHHAKENRFPEVSVKVELGFQAQRTKTSSYRNTSPAWDDELLFVAAEPFAEEYLLVTVQDRVGANKDEIMGTVKIPLHSIPKRTDHRPVDARWYELERHNKEIKEVAKDVADSIKGSSRYLSRIHLMLCFEGGYHVLDESTHYSSDTRPTDRRLWKKPMGVLELGVLGATGLLPMKTREGRSCTDAYCVAKYAQKWIRTRTVVDSFNPQWNEQYTWEVFDPCTVLTVGVFDNHHLQNGIADKAQNHKDETIGKVRIRLSTLETDRVYSHSYPLIVLDKSGVKKKGELELVVRFSCTSRLNMMHAYILPLLPKLHYLKPFHVRHLEALRDAAMKIVITRMARSEPPVRAEVVRYMLDVDIYRWSFRRSKANWYRISKVFSGCVAVVDWFQEICEWKNPVTTVLVHILYLILIWYPELILPTFFLYMFLIGAWHYRFRPRHPPHMDIALSYASSAEPEELDEEFDPIPTSKGHDIVKARYDRLRALAGRIQTVLGDLATQLERFHALLNWRDPRATAIFITFCLLAAVILYVTPFRVIAVLIGVFVLRHPRFRDGMPGVPMNFFRRLPALSDRML